MTYEEAVALATRIIGIWRGGPSRNEWTEVLEPLDATAAGTAFIRLRDELEHPPTIPAFRRAYMALRTRNTADTICDTCDNTGTVNAPDFQRHGRTYRAAMPCPRCPHGRTVARWMKPYADDRAARLRRANLHDLANTEETTAPGELPGPVATVTTLFPT